MVYVRFPIMKTGINPSLKTALDATMALNASQKMLLTRNRIWGNMIGGNCRSGYKELKKAFDGEARGSYYDNHNLKMVFPFIQDWEGQNKKKIKYEERKTRIYMRGVKIGSKRGGDSKSGMSMFEMSNKQKAKSADAAQVDTEKTFKESLKDDMLGL